jgi:hypothetical protein
MENSFVLTPSIVLGLFFIQRYRFLTIVQFAKASGFSRSPFMHDLLIGLYMNYVEFGCAV